MPEMLHIEASLLYQHGHKNTLRINTELYDINQLLNTKKHTNKLFYYNCVDCQDYTIAYMCDAVNHCRSWSKCRFCKLKSKNEIKVNCFVYDKLRELELNPWQVLEIKKPVRDRIGTLMFDLYLEYEDRKYAIEVDGNEHYNNRSRSFRSDKRKVRYCRDNNITLLRIKAPSRQLVPDSELAIMFNDILDGFNDRFKCYNDTRQVMVENILSVYREDADERTGAISN